MVLEIHLSVTEEENTDTIRTRRYLAGNLKRQGRCEEAEVIYLQAIEAAERLFSPPNISLAALHGGYGDCLRLMKRFDESERWLLQAHEAYSESGGAKHRWTLAVVQDLVMLYEDWQKPEERDRWLAILKEQGRK
jgi:tetratricopeptide (TPR) repeat protein